MGWDQRRIPSANFHLPLRVGRGGALATSALLEMVPLSPIWLCKLMIHNEPRPDSSTPASHICASNLTRAAPLSEIRGDRYGGRGWEGLNDVVVGKESLWPGGEEEGKGLTAEDEIAGKQSISQWSFRPQALSGWKMCYENKVTSWVRGSLCENKDTMALE